MARSLQQGINWAHAHPDRSNVSGAKKRIGYGWRWDQLCAAFVYWCIGGAVSYTSANSARRSSGPLVASSRNLPLGAVVWFKIGLYGHVGFHIGDGNILMASHRVVHKWGGGDLGTMTIAQYVAASGAKYLGYSMRYGINKWAGTSLATASTGTTKPVAKPTGKKDEVIWVRRGTGNWWLYDGAGWTEFSVTPRQVVDKALGHGAITLDNDEFDSLKKNLPGHSATATATVDLDALATKVAAKLPKPATVDAILARFRTFWTSGK